MLASKMVEREYHDLVKKVLFISFNFQARNIFEIHLSLVINMIFYKDGLSDIDQLKKSILEDFEIAEQDIEESVVDKIIKCLLEIEQSNLNREEKIYTEEINILLLGQTGCGKSTFINAFKNYMNYEDVERLSLQYF